MDHLSCILRGRGLGTRACTRTRVRARSTRGYHVSCFHFCLHLENVLWKQVFLVITHADGYKEKQRLWFIRVMIIGGGPILLLNAPGGGRGDERQESSYKL